MYSQLRRASYIGLIIVAVFILASAQGVGSSRGLPTSGGSHVIQGHVYLPSGRAAEQGITVKLESGVIGMRSTATDGSGTFIFNSLPAASYTVTVDGGQAYEVLRETVDIYGTAGMGGTSPIGTAMLLDLHLVPKGAAAAFEAEFAHEPKDAVENYKKATQAVKAGNSKKAIEFLNEAIKIDPKFALALSELGTQYLKQNQPQKAAEVLNTAATEKPGDFTISLNYGTALLNLKDLRGAETQLRQALKINDASPVAHMYLGIALLGLSRDEKTKQFYPDTYAEGQKELESAVASGKDEVAMAHRYLGGVYWGNKEYKRAAAEFETYLKLQPKAPDAEKLRGVIQDLKNKN
jgi:tetratricopeptide (TPR) repeat protein